MPLYLDCQHFGGITGRNGEFNFFIPHIRDGYAYRIPYHYFLGEKPSPGTNHRFKSVNLLLGILTVQTAILQSYNEV